MIKNICYEYKTPLLSITQKEINCKSKFLKVSNLIIQICIELGAFPLLINVVVNDVMFIGCCIRHNRYDKEKSYSAIVATMNMRNSHEFYSSVTAHCNDQELLNNLNRKVHYAIQMYQRIHTNLPERILFYQYSDDDDAIIYNYETELQNLLELFNSYYKSNQVKFGFGVATKYINKRFFNNEEIKIRNDLCNNTIVTE